MWFRCCCWLGCVGLLWLGAVACGGKTPTPTGVCGGDALGVCPDGAQCRQVKLSGSNKANFVCVQIREGSNVGGVCDGRTDRCQSDLFCYTPEGRTAESYCTRECTTPSDCLKGYLCQTFGNSKACLRQSTNATEGCRCKRDGGSCSENGHTDCALDDGYFCLSSGPKDPQAICVKSCDPKDPQACKTGFFCSQDTTGRFLCVKEAFSRQDLGGNCANHGKAECKQDLFCYNQYDSDPDAYCSQRCNPYQSDSCPARFVCESPRIDDPFLCIPRGTKDLGDDCSKEGYRSCRSGYCARPDRSSSEAFCSQRCNPSQDDCPSGFSCRLFGSLYRYLCDRAQVGGIGTICNKNGDASCASGLCISPQQGAINRICSQVCDAQKPCPTGWKCATDRQICLPDTGNGQIGDPCQQTEDCFLGNCVTNAAGKRFCTQSCQQDAQCPTDYTCQTFGNGRFCMPQTTQQGKVGDPCPNGAGDCSSNVCITDALQSRTFCSQPCGDGAPCPAPFKCHPVTPEAGFCTPQDYQTP